MINKDWRLQYCYVCQKKGFTVKKGVFCGLTNKPPAFTDRCNEYVYDSDEKERLKETRRNFFDLNEKKSYKKNMFILGYQTHKNDPKIDMHLLV